MRFLALLLLTILCTCVRAQKEMLPNETLITGVVIDAKNGEPLPYVNVFLESNQSRGVLTNEKGEYEIQLTEADKNDRLLFSLLSYKIHVEPVANLLKKSFFNLQMETSFISLGEVVVISDLGLRGLMNKVFEAIPDNYGTDDFVLTAYSRNYQIDEGKYSQFVEAMVNIRDRNYGVRAKNGYPIPFKTRVAEFRMERDTSASLRDRWPVMADQWQLAGFYGSNIARRGNHRNHRSDLRYLDGLTFSNRGEYLDGADTLVRIGYTPNENYFLKFEIKDESDENNWWQSGEYLINKSDLAIIRHTTGDARRGHFNDITYQKVNGKYYLKQLNWYMELEYENDTKQFIDHQVLYVTKVTTDKKASRQAFTGKLTEKSADLADLRVKYDPEFWRENKMLSILGAPEEMRLSMARIQRKVEERKFKKNKTNRDSI